MSNKKKRDKHCVYLCVDTSLQRTDVAYLIWKLAKGAGTMGVGIIFNLVHNLVYSKCNFLHVSVCLWAVVSQT